MAWLTSSVAASVAAAGAAPGGASDASALQPPSTGAGASAIADATVRPATRLSDPSPSLAWRGLKATNGSLNSLATSADADLPLVSHIWTADPAGHVFDGTLWVYTSHDEDERPRGAADGADQFNMRDYRAFSFGHPKSRGRDEGVLLSLEDIPWASRQLWAPGAPHAHTSNRPGEGTAPMQACHSRACASPGADVTRDAHGVYHLFFPAKDDEGRFRIGHAQAEQPQGPFVPDAKPLAGSLSIDPAVFVDDDEGEQPHQAFLLFGGLWGGQLEYLRDEMDAEHAPLHPTRCALAPLMAPLASEPES